jgi:hypothetical protein
MKKNLEHRLNGLEARIRALEGAAESTASVSTAHVYDPTLAPKDSPMPDYAPLADRHVGCVCGCNTIYADAVRGAIKYAFVRCTDSHCWSGPLCQTEAAAAAEWDCVMGAAAKVQSLERENSDLKCTMYDNEAQATTISKLSLKIAVLEGRNRCLTRELELLREIRGQIRMANLCGNGWAAVARAVAAYDAANRRS